ncbi:MAG: hypothetical protein EOO77_37690 [Oxalobacteraceae bacterium]|nr:MAG: hypothetical protein EOO77_37690 [Oxalobacteraceae bacterium]
MKVAEITSRGRRVRMCALQTSAILAAVLAAGPAFAQCSPDPTVTNGTTTCAGTDTDGLTVATANTRIVVADGAVVRPGSSVPAITSQSSSASFQVNGLVDGGAGKTGLFITTGVPFSAPCDPYSGASVGYCFPGSTQTYYPSANATVSIAPLVLPASRRIRMPCAPVTVPPAAIDTVAFADG